MTKQESPLIYHLASLYGLQIAYYDVASHRQQASIESLLAMLHALGAPVSSLNDVPSAWREKQQAIWQRPLEPVMVAWQNMPLMVKVRLPASAAGASLSYHLELETGEERHGVWSATNGEISQMVEVEGTKYVLKRFSLPGFPQGYHRLAVEFQGRIEESLIISAPLKAYQAATESRAWGVFLPLYALRTEKNWGSGDFGDLERLMAWVGELRGQTVATLPLLASFFNLDTDVSPYLPVSRLMWNEFYLDINQIPELAECPSAQALISSPAFQEEINTLRNLPMVAYRRQMALKRRILEELSRYLSMNMSPRLVALLDFTKERPVVEDYARFRAACEKKSCPWQSWSQMMKGGALREGDYDEESRRYHLYVQWLAHQQMTAVSNTARQKGLQLYLDLPLGVHPDGYDAWREAEAFLQGAQAGAPPDTVFTRGQNWAFQPLHPQKIREQGYRYVIAYLRHHMEYAGILRIDHMMGFHRLFCIPQGMEASQGVYLRYPAEELYAILALESQRHKTIIVGEDLGTVPPYVRPAMQHHGLKRMYILRYELAGDIHQGLHPVPPDAVASLNTHDMPPFAGFWQGLDIGERFRLGLLNETASAREQSNLPNVRNVLVTLLKKEGYLPESEEDILSILKACLYWLAASPAEIVLVNLEDLWLETRPQNVPSTSTEYSNWQRKTALTLEEFCQMSQVVDILQTVNKLRSSAKNR